ncbi:hypothetical protein QU507_002014 [Escherichia coli]|uniref:hypothetical protein n=1 Tax=Escherichia TaxID=561 RepID=UPI0008545349|nr:MULTISPECIES: hypothetical protein [Escherichia]EII1143329.1 hypothetical protein [Escherichia coli O121]APL45968.1 hypothetical protein RG65_02200 [Escherichia coli]EEQ7051150.1 hypothetical protein [Escherichia coli]EES4368211.1 hypothetical protein [Escherichia coli]EES7424380.1 hypothetical protein [Escherichia coli]
MGSELISGLVGALIGGLFTLWGTLIDGRRQDRASVNEAKDKQKSVLIGIKAEVETLLELYKARIYDSLENYEGGKPFESIFPLTQNYFSFYESNSFALTSVNEETMKAIVICYGSARSLVDTFRMNNQVLEDLAKLQTIFHETQKDIHRFNLEQTYHIATQYGEGLKQIHGEVMSRIAICLDKINVNLDELEKPEQVTRLKTVLRALAFIK